jgi:fatty acyl-CoA reductase
MVKHHQYAKKNFTFLKPFTSTYSNFSNENSQKLAKSLKESEKKEFPFDVRTIDWRSAMESYVLGVKKYLLKEDCSDEALIKGRQKMKR